ncbi:MAG TPA: carboxymuconolactone decarboxylase family protein [bacterium]|nr:carboxymuconolactone decarboxylase family protein [bacterium]
MSRITPPNASTLPADMRELLVQETARYGTPLHTTQVWTRRPALQRAYREWSQAMRDAPLIPPALRYLVYVRVATINGCPF